MRDLRGPDYTQELAAVGMPATADVIEELRYWQKYLIYAVAIIGFLVWLMLQGGRRE